MPQAELTPAMSEPRFRLLPGKKSPGKAGDSQIVNRSKQTHGVADAASTHRRPLNHAVAAGGPTAVLERLRRLSSHSMASASPPRSQQRRTARQSRPAAVLNLPLPVIA